MKKLCETLRDVESLLFFNDESELAFKIVQVLTKCEAEVAQVKIENLKRKSNEKNCFKFNYVYTMNRNIQNIL